MELYSLSKRYALLARSHDGLTVLQDRLKPGYRFVHLFDAQGRQTKGVILLNIKFTWQLRDQPGAQQTLPIR
jgi:hypothetical protein